MPTIKTLTGRSEFSYTGNCIDGFHLEYTGRPFVSPELIRQIKLHFQGEEVAGGFNMNNPSGFGLWLQQNTNFSSKHGSHIAAVVVHEGLADFRQEGNRVILIFP